MPRPPAMFRSPLGHFANVGESLAGGVNQALPSIRIRSDEATNSVNWRHRQGQISLRDGTSRYDDAYSSTAPPNGLGRALFENGNQFLMVHEAGRILSWDGTSLVDRTGSLSISGTNDDFWTNASVLNKYFACNGASNLIYFDGTTTDFVVNAAGYSGPSALIGKYVAGFAGRVVLANTVESGNNYRNRLRYCADSQFNKWDPAVDIGAAAVDLADTPGEIRWLAAGTNELVVLKEDVIVIGKETGDVNKPLVFPTWLSVGCLSGRSAQFIRASELVFLGHDNVYMLSSGEVRPIGDRIIRDLFNNLNEARVNQIVSFTRPSLGLYYLVIPTGSDDWSTRAYVYNWIEDTWAFELLSAPLYSGITIALAPVTTWDTITGTWDDHTESWDSYVGTAASPVTVLGVEYGSTEYRLHKYSNVNTDEYSTGNRPITATWSSKDFRATNEDGSATRVTLYGLYVDYSSSAGGTLSVAVSTDRGATTAASNAVTLESGTNKRIHVPLITSGVHFRVTLQTTDIVSIHNVDYVTSTREPLL